MRERDKSALEDGSTDPQKSCLLYCDQRMAASPDQTGDLTRGHRQQSKKGTHRPSVAEGSVVYCKLHHVTHPHGEH